MSRPPNIRLLTVYEFAGQSDHMLASLATQLRAEIPDLELSKVAGCFTVYQPGGLRLRRIANLGWVYFGVVLHLLGRRPSAVLVHSAPPGVQLWTVFLASLRKIPVIFWLMDYHPEIEARILERRGWRTAARLLRRLDGRLMPHFNAIITLDRAMADLARSRAGAVEIWEHPTWGNRPPEDLPPTAARLPTSGESLRLAYSGNLGVAHDVGPLRDLFTALAATRAVSLVVIGSSPEGESRFRQLAEEVGFDLQVLPRVPFDQLPSLYEQYRVNVGIVLLAAASQGLVSPSKFSGYINFSLPLVYLGPADTNAALVCTRFGGGFWLSPDAGPADIARTAGMLLDPEALRAAAAGARAAALYFAGFNGSSLARLLAPRLQQLAQTATP